MRGFAAHEMTGGPGTPVHIDGDDFTIECGAKNFEFGGSIIGIMVEVKRWRQTGIIADNFRVVGGIQPFLRCMGVVADIVTDWVSTR